MVTPLYSFIYWFLCRITASNEIELHLEKGAVTGEFSHNSVDPGNAGYRMGQLVVKMATFKSEHKLSLTEYVREVIIVILAVIVVLELL